MTPGRALTPAEQRLFADFFAALRRQGIPFVFLRNYEDFPARIGHDLDLFVRRKDAHPAGKIFRELLFAAGGSVLIVHERDYFLDIRFVLGNAAPDSIHLDLYHGSFTWHGLPYLTEDQLLVSVRECNGLPVPRPAHEALNVFMASILWGGFYKVRYQPRIAELLAAPEERAEFERCVQNVFGPDGTPPFDPCSTAHPDKTVVKKYAAQLRRAMKRRALRHTPFVNAGKLTRHWWAEFKCACRPKGMVLAVIGPDADLNARAVEGLVQHVGELFGERQLYHAASLEISENHGRAKGFFHLLKKSLVRWRQWPRLFLKSKAQGQLVVFDYSAVDEWSAPGQHGFGRLPGWLLKLAARCAPEPDFTFVLLPDADTLVRSEKKLSIESARKQVSRYHSWAGQGRRHFPVDAMQPLPAIVDCVEATLVAYLRRREQLR